jgi:hypothetical protein
MARKCEHILFIIKNSYMKNKKNKNRVNPFHQRWICMVHVLPSSLEKYYEPGMVGAFVSVVGDAETEEKFIELVHLLIEEKMKYPILEIEDIELLSPERVLSPELQEIIDQDLPHSIITYGPFCCYTSEEDKDGCGKFVAALSNASVFDGLDVSASDESEYEDENTGDNFTDN